MVSPPEEQCTLYIFHGEDETMFTAMHWYSPNHPDNYNDNQECLLGPGSEVRGCIVCFDFGQLFQLPASI